MIQNLATQEQVEQIKEDLDGKLEWKYVGYLANNVDVINYDFSKCEEILVLIRNQYNAYVQTVIIPKVRFNGSIFSANAIDATNQQIWISAAIKIEQDKITLLLAQSNVWIFNNAYVFAR